MLTNRLILTLLIDNGICVNSHRFNIQRVANLKTVEQYLNFEAIDELVLLNVNRSGKNIAEYAEQIKAITQKCFVPVTAGGGVQSVKDMHLLLSSGADKVVVNTAAYDKPELLFNLSKAYGRQSVVIAIDVKQDSSGQYRVYTSNGSINTGMNVLDWAREAESMGAGEIYLTSIDHDGTGQGYDLGLLKQVVSAVGIPVIASGGVGQVKDLVDGVLLGGVKAVSIANLFHFTGYRGLEVAKRCLEREIYDEDNRLWIFY